MAPSCLTPVRAAICAAILALLSHGPSQAADKALNLYIWSDYLAPDTLANFTKRTGIAVNTDVFDSSEMLEAKLLAGGSGYDVIVPNGPVLRRFIQAGVVRPLDKAKLPNIATQDPAITAGAAGVDPGNAAKLAKCGVYVFDSQSDIFEVTLNFLGLDPHSAIPADYDKAAELWKKIRPFVSKFHNSEYISALANGDICVAMGFSGDIFQARDRAAEAKKGVTIAYSLPKEGTVMWSDFMAIPKDAPHADAAYAFLNYILDPKVIGPITNKVFYANGNAEAGPYIDPDILKDKTVYPDPSTMKKLFAEMTPAPDIERLRTRIWNRVKAGN